MLTVRSLRVLQKYLRWTIGLCSDLAEWLHALTAECGQRDKEPLCYTRKGKSDARIYPFTLPLQV